MNAPARPLSLLVAALGGEGGAVLAGWLVRAARLGGYLPQSTSIPGVAQRTGATTYYLEFQAAGAADPPPVMALTAFPGHVDVMLASELVEVGRAIENGYVTPERTVLIGSTHRVYAMQEKTAMADARFDAARILEAARVMAKRTCLFDMQAIAARHQAPLSAVMLGALAGCAALPFSAEHCEEAIRGSGIAVENNLRAFRAALEAAQGASTPGAASTPAARPAGASAAETAEARPDIETLTAAARARLLDYQGQDYARRFDERLRPVLELDRRLGGEARGFALAEEVIRQLALRMSYEDVIRVADLKTRPDRMGRIREELRAAPGDPVVVTEFLKPGIEEWCSVLPAPLGRALTAWSRRHGYEDRFNVGLRIRSSTVSGYLALRLLARLRRWRPHTWRYREEQEQIERWLGWVTRAAEIDYAFGCAVAELAGLVKGYGETRRRGLANYERIVEALVRPGVEAGRAPVEALGAARRAALADPQGKALDRALAGADAPPISAPAA